MRSRWQGSRGRMLLAAAAIVAGIAGACAKKAAIVEPPPVVPGVAHIEGNRVLWDTDRAARGCVRYGFTAGDYTHMAYPDAAGRGDRAFTQSHTIALLDLTPGRKVYYQAVSEPQSGATSYTPPDSFIATTGPTPNLLLSTMIHIGFGDSHLLTMPMSRKRILIDAGTQSAETSVETYLSAHGVTSLDVMLATHTHLDHMGGQVGQTSGGNVTDGVIYTFPAPLVLDSPTKSGASQGSNAYVNFLATLSATARTPTVIRRFDTSATQPALQWDPAVTVRCLNSGTPPNYSPVGGGTDVNNESIVLRFSYGNVDFVIGGDAEDFAEEGMVGAFQPEQLEVEFAKIHHHGLQDASSQLWIQALQPRVGFIPNTAYSWSPPSSLPGAIAESSGRLRDVGAHIYVVDEALPLGKPRTSAQYNTTFVTDGQSYEVRIERATQPAPVKVVSDCGPHGDVPAGRHPQALGTP